MKWISSLTTAFASIFLLSGTFGQSPLHDTGNGEFNPRSYVGMTRLLRLERDFIRNLEDYTNLIKNKGHSLHLFLNEIRLEHEKAECDVEQYLLNPLNTFSLLRRMHSDWSIIKNYMNQSEGQGQAEAQVNFMEKNLSSKPTVTNLDKAKAGLYSIQTTYNLKGSDMAKGLINGRLYNASLSALDCYEIGLHALHLESFESSIDWFKAALEQYKKGNSKLYEMLGFRLGDVWRKISDCYYELREFDEELKAVEAISYFDANNDYKTFVRALINDRRNRMGCRGSFKSSLRLKCRFDTTSSPILKIAPVKMEILQESPNIFVYHGILSDREIDQLKKRASLKLQHPLKGSKYYNKERTASRTNIDISGSRLAQRIHQRVIDVTGMDLEGGENLHIVNYGLGGHYYNHVDYYASKEEEDGEEGLGNRLAIILFSLNDVEQGGATIYPQVETAYYPKKGSAIFWKHLDNAGNGNPDSLHAACPVVYGTKWISLKLMYANPQMFKSPCLPIKRNK